MEWSNAKKFVIVLLVLLNVLLAGLNYNQNRENTMTATQERSIFEVLSRNGITMYTDLLTEHPPMSRLAVELPSYNKETLERAACLHPEVCRFSPQYALLPSPHPPPEKTSPYHRLPRCPSYFSQSAPHYCR